MSTPRNILIVRLSAIGDVVMASPLVEAFKRTYPDARVSWLVEGGSKPVLEANTDLDEVIVWPRGQWSQALKNRHYLYFIRQFWSFVRDLRRKKFDLAVDAQGLLKSGIWVYLSGAASRIGIGSREGSRYLMTRVVDRKDADNRISSQYRLLAENMGLDIGEFQMTVSLSPEAKKYAEQFSSGLSSGYAVFCPFTTRPQKHWIEERWRELADRIIDRFELTVVLLGGPDDKEAGDLIAKPVHPRILNMAGKTTIQQAAALIKSSSLLIGVDTGLTHMGFALDAPTIALFGATAPYLNTEGTSGTVLYHPMECSPCRRNPTCEGDYTCMKAISTDEVVRTARSLLESP
ncbi:MAG: lipopolysaccharide heptosyltransferase II [bacterium]|nr:lipopolysaccharide heptosyltransferase II [bacterium]MDT8365276.1 lipopolysaccharide heptosyltransferase II [bacterium]